MSKSKRSTLVRTITIIVCIAIIAGTVIFAQLDDRSHGEDLTGVTHKASYNEIYDFVTKQNKPKTSWFNSLFGSVKGIFTNHDNADAVLYEETAAGSLDKTSGSKYSETHAQVAGIKEDDIIKTDGSYIYVLSSDLSLRIISANKGEMEIVSAVEELKNSDAYCGNAGFYLFNDLIVVIYQVRQEKNIKESASGDGDYYASYRYIDSNENNINTVISFIDISNRRQPKIIKELSQSGTYTTSRLNGDYLYLVTNFNITNPIEDEHESYIPWCGEGDEKSLLEPRDIIINDDDANVPEYGYTYSCIYPSYCSYTVVSSISLSGTHEFVSSQAIAGKSAAPVVYMDHSDIYVALAMYNYKYNYDKIDTNTADIKYTYMYKLPYADGIIEKSLCTRLNGTLLNQFAIDSHDGYLRICVAIERYEYVNSYPERKIYSLIYILDGELEIVGTSEKLAPGETLKSCRFDGDTAYVVTFLQVDPLFTVDLSDPTSPTVLSELKIPGYSTYLQPYGEGKLLGFGIDINENWESIFKLSMFDISNRDNVIEEDVFAVQGDFSEAVNDHKALLVNAEKNIIGFITVSYGYEDECYYMEFCRLHYYFVKYENGAFRALGDFAYTYEKGYNENLYYGSDNKSRIIYIGDYLYAFVDGLNISSFDIDTLTPVDRIVF